MVLAHAGGPQVLPLQVLPAVVFALLYARRARTLRDRGRPVDRGRQACWYGGLALILATQVSPLAHVGDELFLAHMAEHLLMADVGALLLVLGLTGQVLAPVLRIPGFGVLRVLAHPVVAFVLW